MLAVHPGAGRYIARKLCRRLISDDPPEAAISALRGIGSDFWLNAFPYQNGVPDYAEEFLRYYNRIGQALFNWRPPQ